jgi:quercetin dioxygenase-like cupin family protein
MGKNRDKAEPEIQIENDSVRVTKYHFSPGAETGFHEHFWDYLVVPQTDGELLLINEKGIEIKAELREGISYYRKSGVRHNVINNGKKDLIFIEIEIKGNT